MCVTTPMASAPDPGRTEVNGVHSHVHPPSSVGVVEATSPCYFAAPGGFDANHKSTVQRRHRPPNLELSKDASVRPGIQAIRMPNSASVPQSIPLLGLPEDGEPIIHVTSTPTVNSFQFSGPLSASSANPRYRSPSLPVNVIQPTTPVDIPTSIKSITCEELSHLVGDPKVFIVDIRPFKHYCISRLRSATNICIPSTLLKRPNYLLSRFAECMAPEHRHKLSDFSQYSHTVIYDDDTVCLNGSQPSPLAYTLVKFAKVPELERKLYYLEGGFKKMAREYPDTISESAMETTDDGSSSCSSHSGAPSNLSLNGKLSGPASHRQTLSLDAGMLQPPLSHSSRHQHKVSNSSTSSINTDTTGSTAMTSTSPVLCGFSLPSLSITEMKPSISAKALSNINYDYDYEGVQLSMPDINTHNEDKFPDWLKPIIGQMGPQILAQKFKDIQLAEKARLEGMFVKQDNSQDESQKYSISKAVEYGHKNRYNNIWPYDHARVVLNKPLHEEVPPSPISPACDYINASYIAAKRSHKRYIATQAPIPETFKDFWKVVWDEACPVIMMLTAVAEGGFLKSHNYWEPGKYGKLELTREVDDVDLDLCPQTESKVTIRKFILRHTPTGRTHHVAQIHYTEWPDLGTPVSAFDLLALCQMKEEFIVQWKQAHNLSPECGKDRDPISIVHCSAGCGRTGTFCTIDSVIDMMSCKHLPTQCFAENEDVINATVKEFRCQRLSMVQSMRQFAMCYEAIGLWCMLNR